jgi:hypothetical protein
MSSATGHEKLRAGDRDARPASAQPAAVIATVGLALLVAACSGSPGGHVAQLGSTATQSSSSSKGPGGSSNAAGSTNSQSTLAFSRCMRAHGLSNFPDQVSGQKFPGAQQLGVSPSQFQAAYNTCKHLLPNGGNPPNETELQQKRTALLPFARCMRSHGVSNWPDPTIYTNPDGDTAVVFNFIGTSLDGDGFNSPLVQAKTNVCQHLLPPSHGGPPYFIVRSRR